MTIAADHHVHHLAPAALIRASLADDLRQIADDADAYLVLCADPDGARDRYATAAVLIVDTDGARALGYGFTRRRNFVLVHRGDPTAARTAVVRGCDHLVDLTDPAQRRELAELLAAPYAEPQPRPRGASQGSRFD